MPSSDLRELGITGGEEVEATKRHHRLAGKNR
jgi:hypothetical protein